MDQKQDDREEIVAKLREKYGFCDADLIAQEFGIACFEAGKKIENQKQEGDKRWDIF